MAPHALAPPVRSYACTDRRFAMHCRPLLGGKLGRALLQRRGAASRRLAPAPAQASAAGAAQLVQSSVASFCGTVYSSIDIGVLNATVGASFKLFLRHAEDAERVRPRFERRLAQGARRIVEQCAQLQHGEADGGRRVAPTAESV